MNAYLRRKQRRDALAAERREIERSPRLIRAESLIQAYHDAYYNYYGRMPSQLVTFERGWFILPSNVRCRELALRNHIASLRARSESTLDAD